VRQDKSKRKIDSAYDLRVDIDHDHNNVNSAVYLAQQGSTVTVNYTFLWTYLIADHHSSSHVAQKPSMIIISSV